jgi:hypothetical protein
MRADEKLPWKKLERVLMNRPAIEAQYFVAHARARQLQDHLRELEIQIAQSRELLDLTAIPSWPPLPEPIRPPTLHDAIRLVLEARRNQWTRTRVIAGEIALRRLYRRRDGLAASVKDVSARISDYPGLFIREGSLVRLRLAPQGTPRLRDFRSGAITRRLNLP